MTEPESVGQILAGLTIAPRRAALLIVDVQERLAAAMSGEARERVDAHR